MTCLCIDELRPASFRGVPFYVKGDKIEYGRRIVTHEYPMRDTPYNEDLGEKAQKFSVTGYVFGDNWIGAKDAIVAACRQRGVATLQLPAEGPRTVVCNTLSVSRSKDECGYFELTFTFTSADNATSPIVTGVLESLIGALFVEAAPMLTTFFDSRYVVKNALNYVSDNQVARLTQFTSDVVDTVESQTTTDNDASTDIVQAAIGVYQNVESYAQPDPATSLALVSQPIPAAVIAQIATDTGYAKVSDTGVTVTSGASAIVPVIGYIIGGIGDSLPVDEALTALTYYATWSVSETVAPSTQLTVNPPITPTLSPSDQADVTNGQAFCGVVRSFALMKLAQAISVMDFATQLEAVQARANIVELFNMQIEQFDEDAIVNKMLAARDLAVKAVTQKMANIAPIIQIAAPMNKPSLYWAYRLYADPTRAEELADRNSVVNPAFMPTRFEALAR